MLSLTKITAIRKKYPALLLNGRNTMVNLNELIQQLTLEEKAELLTGGDFWHTRAIERLMGPVVYENRKKKVITWAYMEVRLLCASPRRLRWPQALIQLWHKSWDV